MKIGTMATAAGAALMFAGVAAAEPVKSGTTWINQFGSTLIIDAINDQTGLLTGTYISQLGQYCVGTKHAAIGWADNDRLTFMVRWKTPTSDCASITSWIGSINKGRIVAYWDLIYTSPVDGSNFVHRGTDVFEPCSAGKPKGCPEPAIGSNVRPAPPPPPPPPMPAADTTAKDREREAAATAEARRQADLADARRQSERPTPPAPATPVATQPPTSAAAAPTQTPDEQEAAKLMARATALLDQGNIGAARVVLARAVETGSPQANFALAETFDPLVLATWKTYGTVGDTAKAREFYSKALAGGVQEAMERLNALATVKD